MACIEQHSQLILRLRSVSHVSCRSSPPIILSRLVYSNATLAGLPANLLSQLQVQWMQELVWYSTPIDVSTLHRSIAMASRPWADHFQTGDSDVPMRRRDCSWLPISRLDTSRRCTRPRTSTLSCIIFTCHSSYPTFYNWWSHLFIVAGTVKLPQEIRSAIHHYLFSDVDWKLIVSIAFNSCKVIEVFFLENIYHYNVM